LEEPEFQGKGVTGNATWVFHLDPEKFDEVSDFPLSIRNRKLRQSKSKL